MDEAGAVIADLNRRMLAALTMPPMWLGPPPRRCPVCGTTRAACVAFYGHDRVHEQDIRDRLSCQDAEWLAGSGDRAGAARLRGISSLPGSGSGHHGAMGATQTAEETDAPWCPCGHGEDDLCLNGLIYGSCGDENCGGGCTDTGTCAGLPGCCAAGRA